MDGEEVYMPLPEDLVERVLAMVPYPQIFKARELSKSWFTRFAPISSLDDDEEKKQSTISFRKRVSENSDNWKTFCPVFVGMDHLVAYDRESQDWQKIPTLSFLPEDHPMKSSYPHLEIEGALVLICTPQSYWKYGLHVANILTRKWKQLPTHLLGDGISFLETKLVSYKDRYKVICFCHFWGLCLVQTYDSQLETWSDKEFDNLPACTVLSQRRANLNGVLYWVVSLNEEGREVLLAFNLKEETLEVLQMPPIDVPMENVYLVVCNASLLLVVYIGEEYDFDNAIVLKIDVELRRWVKVSEGPPYKLPLGSFNLDPVSDGDCIFFAGNDVDQFLSYNVRRDEWSAFFIPASFTGEINQVKYQREPCSFRAGPNPFVAL